jgi:hypothetical protein
MMTILFNTAALQAPPPKPPRRAPKLPRKDKR